jgi:hypothetical protein
MPSCQIWFEKAGDNANVRMANVQHRAMTKQEFTEKQRAWNLNTMRALAAYFAVYGALFGGAIFYSQYTAVHGGPVWFSKVLPVVLLVIFASQLPFIFWHHNYRLKRYGVCCEGCGKQLLGGKKAFKRVIASGCCGFCGAKVCN